jgi:hypothetical protein
MRKFAQYGHPVLRFPAFFIQLFPSLSRFLHPTSTDLELETICTHVCVRDVLQVKNLLSFKRKKGSKIESRNILKIFVAILLTR